jgi:hypothetical protein
MNFGKKLVDKVLSIAMAMIVNGGIFLGETIGMGWEAEHERSRKRKLSYLPRMEELNAFPGKDKRRMGANLLAM